MAFIRPAGFSDEDSDSDDDYGNYDKQPCKPFINNFENQKKLTESILKEAITNGDLDAFKVLLKHDLKNDVNAKLNSGWTPLLYACLQGQENLVQYLLENGADPNLNSDSITPLMMACSNVNADESAITNIVLSLIKKNSILNIGDKYGSTPLMRASSNGHYKVVQLLLENPINIDMRDSQGWTALYWAIQNNQHECLKLLLSKGATAKLTDLRGYTPADIAESQGHTEILDLLLKHLKIDEESEDDNENLEVGNSFIEWENYYPGLKKNEPDYSSEIFHLLEGMNCKRAYKLVCNAGTDLRSFLLLEKNDLIKLGMDMPYERQRIKYGLRSFHTRNWTLKSVAGLYAGKSQNYTILECLNVLGSHMQQLYILEATLAYVLRDYGRVLGRLEEEPPDSTTKKKLQDAVKKIYTNINSIRNEIRSMKKIHEKISKESLRPADLIEERSALEVVRGYTTGLALICAVGYIAKVFVMRIIKL